MEHRLRSMPVPVLAVAFYQVGSDADKTSAFFFYIILSPPLRNWLLAATETKKNWSAVCLPLPPIVIGYLLLHEVQRLPAQRHQVASAARHMLTIYQRSNSLKETTDTLADTSARLQSGQHQQPTVPAVLSV